MEGGRVSVEGGWGLTPQRGNISSGFVSMRAVLICDLTRTQSKHADLTLVLPP